MALPLWGRLLIAGVAVLLLNSVLIGNGVVWALGVLLVVIAVVVLVADAIGDR